MSMFQVTLVEGMCCFWVIIDDNLLGIVTINILKISFTPICNAICVSIFILPHVEKIFFIF